MTMKILISENKINWLIREYLDDEYYPDYDWGPELHDFYKKDVKRYGGYEFEVNDKIAYAYYDSGFYDKTLIIFPWLSEKLTSLFNNKWLPVFKEWFEDNSGLKVIQIINDEIL